MRRIYAIALAFAFVAIAGCAVSPATTTSDSSQIDIDSYRLLAEIALARQRNEEATEHFLNAALVSDDPAYAERTAQMAYRLGFDTLGHRAIARWRQLDPSNRLTDYFSGIFEMRSGRVGAAVENFSTLLDSLSDLELGGGFVLIFDALTSEPTVGVAAQIMFELTSRFPATRESHYAMAQLALRAGSFGLALEEAEAAIVLSPEWPEAQLLYARTLLVAGRSDEALSIASELADQYDNTEVKLQFAELLLSAGEDDQARVLLNEILAENPGMPEAIRALAFLALSKDELDVAREQFEMLRSNPDYRNETYYYLGVIAEMESDYLQATRSFSRVTDGVRAVEAHTRTGAILFEQMGDPESAMRHLREFGNANPRFAPEMLLAEARLLLALGRAQDAIDLIDGAIGDDAAIADQDLLNAHVDFYVALMDDALNREEMEEAEAWIEEGFARYPDNQRLRYAQTRLLQDQGRVRRSVAILEDLIDESPNNATFLNALGYVLTDRLGRHEEARDYIQRALALQPDSGAILDSMGWVLFHLGEYELALDYLERAYRALEVTEVLAHIIDVHWAMGNTALAVGMLEEGLADAPEDAFLLDVRDRLQQ